MLQHDVVDQSADLQDAANESLKEETDEDDVSDSLLRVEVNEVADAHHATNKEARKETIDVNTSLLQPNAHKMAQAPAAVEEANQGAPDDDVSAALLQFDVNENVTVPLLQSDVNENGNASLLQVEVH